MTWVLASFLKPVVALIMFGLIALPGRIAVERWMKPGKLKSLLLTRIVKEPPRY